MNDTKKVVKKSIRSNKAVVMGPPNFMQDMHLVPADVQAEIKAKGLDSRWISYSKWVKMGGMHERGWSVYRRDKPATGTEALAFGSGADGIIRRGDNVLATRPLDWTRQHRDYIREQNLIKKGQNKSKADELRAMARGAGLDISVDEKYDGDESDEDSE